MAEPVSYGSFRYDDDLPGVLFLSGAIESGDSFELRRAMRDQTIDLVVTASPGGSLYEGLQIAAILHDNDIGTYVPEGVSCESSCANIFLGGTSRMLLGELGVHQFYSNDTDTAAPKSVTTAATQYTTSDIIGIMNQFDTPPFVYEKMFGTTEIYYFNGAQKAQLNRGLDDMLFLEQVAQVDAFLKLQPALLTRSPEEARPVAAAGSATVAPVAPQISPAPEEMAFSLLTSINDDWSLPNEQALSRIPTYYAGNVEFYGTNMSHAEVMAEKETFAKRWPIRNYRVEVGSIRINCRLDSCVVDSVISWAAASPQRGAQASGRSTWTLVLVASSGQLRIVSENGKTLQRD